MRSALVLEPLPGPSRHAPPVRWIVEGIGVTQSGGGTPYARRVPVIEVLQRVSVLVVSLIFWSAR